MPVRSRPMQTLQPDVLCGLTTSDIAYKDSGIAAWSKGCLVALQVRVCIVYEQRRGFLQLHATPRAHLQCMVAPIGFQECSHCIRQLRIRQQLTVLPQIKAGGFKYGLQDEKRPGMLHLRPMLQCVNQALQDQSSKSAHERASISDICVVSVHSSLCSMQTAWEHLVLLHLGKKAAARA